MICRKWSRPRYKLPDNMLYADISMYIAELQRYIRAVPLLDGGVRLIAIDGIYGPETRQAVAEFQRDFGLPVTAVVDNRTWDMIFDEYERAIEKNSKSDKAAWSGSTVGSLMSGDSGASVFVLQTLINELSEHFVNVTPVPFSGDYDKATENAVIILQQMLRMPADGIADRNVWNSVMSMLDMLKQ